MSYARHIIKKEGLGFQGLNKGFTATLGRHGVFNMVYFGFYFNVKNIIPVNKVTTWSIKILERKSYQWWHLHLWSVYHVPLTVLNTYISYVIDPHISLICLVLLSCSKFGNIKSCAQDHIVNSKAETWTQVWYQSHYIWMCHCTWMLHIYH